MVGVTTQTEVYLVYYSAHKLIQLTSSARLATLKKNNKKLNQKRNSCEGHTGRNMDVTQETLVYFGVTHYTMKQNKNLYGCVCVGNVSLCVKRGEMRWVRSCVCSLCVCVCVRVRVCVCARMYSLMSGDICCVAGWELSTVGLQEPQTKEMKAEVTTWTSGTRH